jgi:hypothetical protein
MLFITRIGHGFAHVHFIQIKTDLSSCLRHLFGYVTLWASKIPNDFSLLADSFLQLYVISLGFLVVNMELSGTTRQVPSFGI